MKFNRLTIFFITFSFRNNKHSNENESYKTVKLLAQNLAEALTFVRASKGPINLLSFGTKDPYVGFLFLGVGEFISTKYDIELPIEHLMELKEVLPQYEQLVKK